MKEKNRKARDIPSRHILYAVVLLCAALIASTWLLGNTNPVTDRIADAIIPMQTGLNSLGGTIAAKLENLRTLWDAQEENQLLKEELAVLRSENSRLQEDHYELERLRTLLNLKDEYSQYTMTAARIIHKDSGHLPGRAGGGGAGAHPAKPRGAGDFRPGGPAAPDQRAVFQGL